MIVLEDPRLGHHGGGGRGNMHAFGPSAGHNSDIFGLGQDPTKKISKEIIDRVRSTFEKYGIYFIMVGMAFGALGIFVVKETPFEPMINTVAGFFLSAGLIPFIMQIV